MGFGRDSVWPHQGCLLGMNEKSNQNWLSGLWIKEGGRQSCTVHSNFLRRRQAELGYSSVVARLPSMCKAVI